MKNLCLSIATLHVKSLGFRIFFLSVLLGVTSYVQAQHEFITTWQTTTASESITIPTFSGETYNYDVDWGDGDGSSGVTGDAIHTYTTAGTYTVKITGTFPRIYFNNSGDRLKIRTIEQWGAIAWASMANAFYGCSSLTYNATDTPDLSGVVDMSSMFHSASLFNGNIGNWNVSNVENMRSLFLNAQSFNQDLDSWNVSKVTNMELMFLFALVFNGNIGNWDVGNVTNMDSMFYTTNAFNQSLANWNVSKVTTMNSTFRATLTFNGDITTWNVSNVTDMTSMFHSAIVFNRDLTNWNVHKVTSMHLMFIDARLFNGDLSTWDVSNVTNMDFMFQDTPVFNNDISSWNVSKVTSMNQMFYQARGFNQPIGQWNTSAVTNMNNIFQNTNAFDQDLSGWDVSKVTTINILKSGAPAVSGWSTKYVDKTLIAWSKQSLQNGVSVFIFANYCHSEAAIQRLSDDFGWGVNVILGQSCTNQEFKTTWQTTAANESITIPVYSGGTAYNYNVDWGDGQSSSNQTGSASHTYTTAGTYTVTITGEFPRIYFSAVGSRAQIRSIAQWGTINWSSMNGAFYGCTNLGYSATDTPDLSNVTDLSSMFAYCMIFNGDIDNWDVSNVINMQGLFLFALAFNQDLNGWNTSNVTNMSEMFDGTAAFNGNISNWNTSKVTNMYGMFARTNFNQAIGNWNTASVVSMSDMFSNASAFNQDISNWNTTNVTTMSRMFFSAPNFNQDIGNWNTAKLAYANAMFFNASNFNQNLGNWNLGSMTFMNNMFDNSGMSTINYDQMLIGWAGQILPNNMTLGASGRTYCLAAKERQKLIDDFGWTITDGGSSCTLTNWDGSAWDNGVPTASVSAAINGNYDASVNGSINCEHLGVKPNVSLTIPTAGTATVAGNTLNMGTIAVQQEGSLIQTAASPSNVGAGTYSFARDATAYWLEYNYWSSPLQQITLEDAFTRLTPNIYSFNASTQAWATETTSTTMEAGKGYAVSGNVGAPGSVTRTLSNTSGYNSGEINLGVTFSNDADATNDWNLIGNPYPSGIDVVSFLATNYNGGSGTIENAVYLWNSDGHDVVAISSDYAIMNAAGVANAGGNTAPSSSTIAAGQGFMVQARTTGNVTFQNAHRTATNNTFLRTSTDRSKWKRAWITATHEFGHSNEILIGFMSDAQMGKGQYDAQKLSGNDHVSFYMGHGVEAQNLAPLQNPSIIENEKFAIQGLPLTETIIIIPLGIHVKTAGLYTFDISHLDQFEGMEVYLVDELTEETARLKQTNYQVDLPVGEWNDRFHLRFVPNRITAIEHDSEELDVQVTGVQQAVSVNSSTVNLAEATIGVYDLMGRQIYKEEKDAEQRITIPISRTGVYIVRIEHPLGILSEKVWVW